MARLQQFAPTGEYSPLHLSAVSQPVNTTPSTQIYAGTQTITPTSLAGVVAGQLFTFSGGTGASENVAVTNLTAADFSATFVNGHSGGYTVVATPISTTASAVSATGSQTVTPASMAGIVVGLSLHVAAGGGVAEDVVVAGVTSTTFTATFTSTHTAGTAVTLGTASNLTLTPTTAIGVAGTKTIAVTSPTNITVGTALHISAGTGTAEDVMVAALPTADTITVAFANTHSGAWTITTPTAQGYIPVGSAVNTTSATTIVAGSAVPVTPASLSGITVGKLLNIAGGTGTAETVRVKSIVAGVSFTADFTNNHSGAYTISSLSPTWLGKVVINQPGSGVSLSLYNGNPNVLPQALNAGLFAVIQPSAAGQSFDFGCVCDYGLFYTLTGTAGDYTLLYQDGMV